MLDWLPSLGSIGSIFSTLWAWRGAILVGVVVVGFMMAYGFLKPLVDILTRTYLEIVLPFAVKILSTVYGRAVVLGLLAFALLSLVWWVSDGAGYSRAKGECNVEIATRERNEAVAQREELQRRLDALEKSLMNDAGRQAIGAREAKANQDELDRIPNDGGDCFDESLARSLWQRP